MTDKEKIELLVVYIGRLFSAISGDWTDPRYECSEGWKAVAKLKVLLGIPGATGYCDREETDDVYYPRIKKELGRIS